MCPGATTFPRSRRIRGGVAAFAAAALIGSLAVGTAQAATPSSGTLTPTKSVLQYTASFTTPATCDPEGSAPCGDEFKLHVGTPAGYGEGHALTVQVDWPNEAADFDVYLLKGGKVIASAASTADPEQLFAAADSGDYIVRIVPFAPTPFGGQIVTSTLRLVQRSSPGTSSLPRPAYRNYKAPEGGRSVHDAGEPTVGINWKTGAAMYQAGLTTYRVNFVDTASSSSAIWTDKSARPPDCTQATSLDPYLFTDNTLSRTFSSQLLANPVVLNSATCLTDDDGDNWKPSQGGGVVQGADHQSLGGGPFSKNSTLGPTTPYPHAVAVSRDNGLRWTVRRVPTSLGRSGDSDPSVGIGSNNTLYFGYQNRDLSNPAKFATARIAVSHDQGETFIRDTDVGAQLGLKNIVFPAVIAGDDNRAAYAFLGTKTAGDYQDNNDTDGTPSFKGVWHLYVATTTDGGQSWVTVDATPNDPVQRGSICTGGTTCGEDRNLLDFMDLDLDAQGRAVVGYADGCTAACVTTTNPTASTEGYHDAYATIARQSGGPRLIGRFDQKPDLIVTDLKLVKDSAGEHISGLAKNIGNAGEQRRGAVPRGLRLQHPPGLHQPAVHLAPGQSKRVGVLDPRNLSGSHTYTAIVDPRNVVTESNEGNNKARRSFNCG